MTALMYHYLLEEYKQNNEHFETMNLRIILVVDNSGLRSDSSKGKDIM